MKKRTVLILGVTGMAGHLLYDYLTNKFENFVFVGVSRGFIEGYSDYLCDITFQTNIRHVLDKFKPEIVINCIGSLVKSSSSHRSQALYVNGYLPIYLSELAVECNFNLVHLSTDCVFDGSSGRYSETDKPTAKDWYGITKSLGENVDFSNTCVIRTSIIGPEIRIKKLREGLFDWFMNQKQPINGYDNVIWSGVTTLELAKFMESTIFDLPKGLIHLTNGIGISKYNLLKKLNDTFNRQLEINRFSSVAHDKSLLVSSKIGYQVASYEQQITNLFDYIYDQKEKYDYSF